jgi:SPP1 family predicted phage head-tail adaptor
MRLGSFNRLARLQRNVPTGELDALDQPIRAWQTVNTFWCEKIHKTEDEAFAASQRYARRTLTFRAHFISDISEVDRLEVDGIHYDIRGIREIGYREGIEIAAEWQT